MSVKESIQYLTDQKTGPSYIVRKYGTGWLETMPDLKMYYLTGIPQPFYDSYVETCFNSVIKTAIESDDADASRKISKINDMTYKYRREKFFFPPFVMCDPGDVTVGNNRLAALILNGLPAENIPVIVYGTPKSNFEQWGPGTLIESTEHFEQMLGLDNVDHGIEMHFDDVAQQMRLDRTIVRHTKYDPEYIPQFLQTQLATGMQIQTWWRRFCKDWTEQKPTPITIEVHCTEETVPLIRYNPEVWKVNFVYQKSQEWSFSYGMLLGQWNRDSVRLKNEPVQAWVYNIEQPLDLEKLVPWVDPQKSCYKTPNEKLVFFYTGEITEIAEIADIAK